MLIRGENVLTTILEGDESFNDIGASFCHGQALQLPSNCQLPCPGDVALDDGEQCNNGPFAHEDGIYLRNLAFRGFGAGVYLFGDEGTEGALVRPIIANCMIYDNVVGIDSENAAPCVFHDTLAFNEIGFRQQVFIPNDNVMLEIKNTISIKNALDLMGVNNDEITSSTFDPMKAVMFPGQTPYAPPLASCPTTPVFGQNLSCVPTFVSENLSGVPRDLRLTRNGTSIPLSDNDKLIDACPVIPILGADTEDGEGTGNPRLVDMNFDGTAHPDMGADEYAAFQLINLLEGTNPPTIANPMVGLDSNVTLVQLDGPPGRQFAAFAANNFLLLPDPPSGPVGFPGVGGSLFVSPVFITMPVITTGSGPVLLGFPLLNPAGGALVPRIAAQAFFSDNGVGGVFSNYQDFVVL